MTNLDSILKSRDITLPTKVCQVRAMVFPVVMYGCESRTIRKDAGGGGLVAKSCLTLVTPWTVACQVPLPLDSPGKNTGVGCHFLLQGIFPTQESNPGLLHCRQILYWLSYEGSPFFFQCIYPNYSICWKKQQHKNLLSFLNKIAFASL